MSLYDINDLYTSIQGEGCQTGIPMTIVRLMGCDVGCPWCDTKETWEALIPNRVESLAEAKGANEYWVRLSASEVAAAVLDDLGLRDGEQRWVLVTGGEPAATPLQALVHALHDAHLQVALETSGTALGHVGAGCDWVCVSPKIDMPGDKPILPEALAMANEIKHVVGKPADIDELDELLTEYAAAIRNGVAICLQPVSASPRATELCIETTIKRGWRLSVQTHKYIDVK